MNDILNFDWSELMRWAIFPDEEPKYPVAAGNISSHSYFTPENLRWHTLAMFLVELVVSLYLHHRQYSHLTENNDIPEIVSSLAKGMYTLEDFKKSREYNQTKVVHSAGSKFYYICLWLIAIHFDWIYIAWDLTNDIGMWDDLVDPVIERNILFALIVHIAHEILISPITIHLVVVEWINGFFQMKEFEYLVHHFKRIASNMLSIAFCAGIGAWALKVLDTRTSFVQAMVLASLAYLFVILCPSYDVACFLNDKKHVSHFEEMSSLKSSLERLCDRVGFPKRNLCFLNKSLANVHSSAFYFGFLSFQRIGVFYRAIQGHPHAVPGKGLPPKQVEAILAHELGHWHFNHSIKQLFIWHFMHISTAIILYYYRASILFLRTLGFPSPSESGIDTDKGMFFLPGAFVAYYVIFRWYHFILETAIHLQQRESERDADKYAADLGYKVELEKSIVKLAIDQETFPSMDIWYGLCYHTHPCLVERLQLLKNYHEKVSHE